MNKAIDAFYPSDQVFNHPVDGAVIEGYAHEVSAKKKHADLSFGLSMLVQLAIIGMSAYWVFSEVPLAGWHDSGSYIVVVAALFFVVLLHGFSSWRYLRIRNEECAVLSALKPAGQHCMSTLLRAQHKYPEVGVYLDEVARQGRLLALGEYKMLMWHVSKKDRISDWLDYSQQSPYHQPMNEAHIAFLRAQWTAAMKRGVAGCGTLCAFMLLSVMVVLLLGLPSIEQPVDGALVWVCAFSMVCVTTWRLLGMVAGLKNELEKYRVGPDVSGPERVVAELKKTWPCALTDYLEQVRKMGRPLLQEEVYMLAETTQKSDKSRRQ